MFHHRWMAGLLALLLSAGVARAQDKPLAESQVTEAAIVEALGGAPEVPDGVRKRGFRPVAKPGAPREAPLLITFVTDSAELMPSATRALDVVARALRSDKLAGASFRIEGHADPTGGEEYNLDLSRRRAESVVDYLVRQHGIAPDKLQPVGKGASELLNKRNVVAPENRRVTIVVR